MSGGNLIINWKLDEKINSTLYSCSLQRLKQTDVKSLKSSTYIRKHNGIAPILEFVYPFHFS